MAAAACMSIPSVKRPQNENCAAIFIYLQTSGRAWEQEKAEIRLLGEKKTHQRTSVHRLPRGLLLFRFTWRWKGDAAGGFSAATQNTVRPLGSGGGIVGPLIYRANSETRGKRLIKYANDLLEGPSFDAGR